MSSIIYNIVKEKPQFVNSVFIVNSFDQLDEKLYSDREKDYINHRIEENSELISLNYFYHWNFIVCVSFEQNDNSLERIRRIGSKLASLVIENELDFLNIIDLTSDKDHTFALMEGLVLSLYKFDKYKKNGAKKQELKRLKIYSKDIKDQDIEEFDNLMSSVTFVRDLINEPASTLTATRFADEVVRHAHLSGLNVEVFRKDDLEKMQMGGILAVNKGSSEPPVMVILKWNHPKATNKKPYVFIGKGVMYDSGGLSLKPTSKSMDYMKSDMSGGAAIAGLMLAIAKNNVPVNAVALIPATDNRLSADAYSPGDVITMHNGKTVEVMNTDAEGRLILADAISFADKFDPEFILSMATLTGSASRAIGPYGFVTMGNISNKYFATLEKAGEKVYERPVRFPFWDDYEKLLKSDIADMKNIGGSEAGAITAGKFLEKFTQHPFIHCDIAGMAFVHKPMHYIKFGGRGVGVRLLYEFIKHLTK